MKKIVGLVLACALIALVFGTAGWLGYSALTHTNADKVRTDASTTKGSDQTGGDTAPSARSPEQSPSSQPAAPPPQLPASTPASSLATPTSSKPTDVPTITGTAQPTPKPSTATSFTTTKAAPKKTPTQLCQQALTLRPFYAPKGGQYRIDCVNRLRGQRGLNDAMALYLPTSNSIQVLINPDSTLRDYRLSVAHEWAHAETDAWGMDKGEPYRLQWLRIIGHKPVKDIEFWNTSDYNASPSELWANARAKCLLGYGDPGFKPVTCAQVNQLVNYINHYNK